MHKFFGMLCTIYYYYEYMYIDYTYMIYYFSYGYIVLNGY